MNAEQTGSPDQARNTAMPGSGHLSLDVLVDAYYGVGGDPAAVRAHLDGCESCTERWNDLARKRSAAVQPVEVSSEFLVAQRRKIYERLEQAPPKQWKLWVPVSATAVVLAAALFAFRPAPPEAPRPEITDAQLFSDVYTLELSYEPSAAAPIQALFEEQDDLGQN